MTYSQAIVDALEVFFHEKNIIVDQIFSSADDERVYKFKIQLHCWISTAQIFIIVRSNNYSIIATIPIKADIDHRLAAAEYLTRINFNMRNGCFLLDMEDGEIRFKTYAFIGDGPISTDLILNMFFIPIKMIEYYSDGILSVIFGFSTPKEAFNAIP